MLHNKQINNMGKNKNGRRSNSKNKKKETFKKFGKNTTKGLRIKAIMLENTKNKTNNIKKQEGNHPFIGFHNKYKNVGKKNSDNVHKVDKKIFHNVRHGHQKKHK